VFLLAGQPVCALLGFLSRGSVPAGISLPHRAPDDGVMVTMPEVHRVGGLIGAELRGLDLTQVYPDDTY